MQFNPHAPREMMREQRLEAQQGGGGHDPGDDLSLEGS